MRTKLVIILVLVLSGFTHAYNMFGFPYFENDEGVYLSQAWSVITEGKLAPYTYWYDHAPAGWMLAAVFLLLTKSLYLFGFGLNSGRVFMLIIHLLSTLLLFKISKKLTNNIWVGVLAVLFFSVSPLGVYFQRRLLLDNIMIFWVLLALNLLLGKQRKLSRYVLSSAAFGLAVLTKENAIVFLPGFIVILLGNLHSYNKRFAVFIWILVTFSIVTSYFLYALLKGEFFPYGSKFGGNSPHVSLLETLSYQSARKGISTFDFQNGTFWVYLRLWYKQDPLIIGLGILANSVIFLYSIAKKNINYLAISSLGLFFWLFLMRGGIVIEFYILPLLPILALLIGVMCYELAKMVKTRGNYFLPGAFLVITLIYSRFATISRAFPQYNPERNIYTSNQTRGQLEAVKWIKQNLDSDSGIVIDNYSYLDLRPTFPKAHWYWKVDQDPEIKAGVFKNSPENIDFVAKTPQMSVDLLQGISLLTSEALDNSRLVKSFNSDGWGVDIFQTAFPNQILQRAWTYYKSRFLLDGRQTVDPGNNITTSEGQSYALLRAVWSDDRVIFDQVWTWTKSNMQKGDGTFAWKFTDGKIADQGSATDADTDIALALLFAAKQWADDWYLSEAKTVLDGVWKTEVKYFNGSYYVVPGNWAKNKSEVIVNPSYLSPYAYRIFAKADPGHAWNELVRSSYQVLNGCTGSRLEKPASAFLPPDWCALDAAGNFHQVRESGLTSTNYSYDALRINFRIAVDYLWFKDEQAKNYLDSVSPFFLNLWYKNQHIPVAFSHDGVAWNQNESALGYASVLANFAATNPEIGLEIYHYKLLKSFQENFEAKTSYWEDPDNYYVQNWAWFATALYADKLPNLWK